MANHTPLMFRINPSMFISTMSDRSSYEGNWLLGDSAPLFPKVYNLFRQLQPFHPQVGIHGPASAVCIGLGSIDYLPERHLRIG